MTAMGLRLQSTVKKSSDTRKASPGPFLKSERPFHLGEGERKEKKRERDRVEGHGT